jgi:hypothetical protein
MVRVGFYHSECGIVLRQVWFGVSRPSQVDFMPESMVSCLPGGLGEQNMMRESVRCMAVCKGKSGYEYAI